MLMEQTKILLFGGSYNPIHKGHINAALNASNYLQCQEVWFIPRKYNYDGSLLLDGKHRIAMMKMALAEFPNFKICDIELKDVKSINDDYVDVQYVEADDNANY